jgi:pantoate--beta-alanine ligase
MRIVREVEELRELLSEPRRAGRRIGLVPTMGAFHAGHLSLMHEARSECDVAVVSLFVNPAQFNDPTDLAAYPRDEARDAALAEEIGVDFMFAPRAEAVYPPGFATTVSVAGLTDRLEGAARGRGHFDGVTTVVSKLFNMVGPDVAYFGQKDAQQVLVIKRMVSDLDLPVQIRVCPTVREADGLALSSRNQLLSPSERRRALALSRALRVADRAVADGERDPDVVAAAARDELEGAGVEPEYFELVSSDDLTPVDEVSGPVLALVAARVGQTRLIDNQVLSPTGGEAQGSTTSREASPCTA